MNRFYEWLAWRLPRGLVYWCAIRLMAHATTKSWGNGETPAVTCVLALKRWDIPND